MRSLLLLSLPLLLAACGASKSGTAPEKDTRLSYNLKFEENGKSCSTGRITATDVKVLCQVLRDEEANQKCAADERLRLQRAYNCSNVTPVEVNAFYYGACEKSSGAVYHVNSNEAQCAALKDEKLNAGCAKEARAAQAKHLGC